MRSVPLRGSRMPESREAQHLLKTVEAENLGFLPGQARSQALAIAVERRRCVFPATSRH